MGVVAESLARLDAGVSWMQVLPGIDERPGWQRCAELIGDPDRLVAWQHEVADAYGGDLLTGQGLVLDAYLAAITVPAAGAFHLDRRVLDVSPEHTSLRPGPGGSPVVAVAVDSSQFHCLVGDSSAVDPEAEAVSDLTTLATAVRDAVAGHADRLVEAYGPTTRIGRHGLWGAVTDALDVAFLTAGWVSGDHDRAAADARLVIGDDDDRLVGGSTLYELQDVSGRRHWTRRRYSCCFLYRSPDGEVCATCPRVSDIERRRQAIDW